MAGSGQAKAAGLAGGAEGTGVGVGVGAGADDGDDEPQALSRRHAAAGTRDRNDIAGRLLS